MGLLPALAAAVCPATAATDTMGFCLQPTAAKSQALASGSSVTVAYPTAVTTCSSCAFPPAHALPAAQPVAAASSALPATASAIDATAISAFPPAETVTSCALRVGVTVAAAATAAAFLAAAAVAAATLPDSAGQSDLRQLVRLAIRRTWWGH